MSTLKLLGWLFWNIFIAGWGLPYFAAVAIIALTTSGLSSLLLLSANAIIYIILEYWGPRPKWLVPWINLDGKFVR